MLASVTPLLTELPVNSETILMAAASHWNTVASLLWQKPDSLLFVMPDGITLTSSRHARELGLCDQHPDSPGNYYQAMKDLILASIDSQPHRDMVRIHEGGDFWTEHYMKAWMLAARERPQISKFYAYTKSLTMWYNLRNEIPDNFYLTASYGGDEDRMLIKHPEVYKRIAYVVYPNKKPLTVDLRLIMTTLIVSVTNLSHC